MVLYIYLFPGFQRDEAGGAEGRSRPGGVDHGDERATVGEVVQAAEAVLRGGEDAEGLDAALLPGEHLLRLPREWDQPDLDALRVTQDQEQRGRVAWDQDKG